MKRASAKFYPHSFELFCRNSTWKLFPGSEESDKNERRKNRAIAIWNIVNQEHQKLIALMKISLTDRFSSSPFCRSLQSLLPCKRSQTKRICRLLNPDLASAKRRKSAWPMDWKHISISDPMADQSAAAMAVQAGSWNDPPNIPAWPIFANICSSEDRKNSPSRPKFSDLVSDSNGQKNAFTAPDRTVYMFSSMR